MRRREETRKRQKLHCPAFFHTLSADRSDNVHATALQPDQHQH